MYRVAGNIRNVLLLRDDEMVSLKSFFGQEVSLSMGVLARYEAEEQSPTIDGSY